MPNQNHDHELQQQLLDMERTAEAQLPGVHDLLGVMDRFEHSNQGVITYSSNVDTAVFFTANTTSGK